MENNYIVYMHTNRINNKKYIGMTKLQPKVRWQNGKGYKNQEAFYTDILAYGWNNFEHEVIYSNLTKQEAQQKEKELIQQYDAISNGYNTYCNFSHYIPREKVRLIHCIELDLVFRTLAQAEEATNTDGSSISKACKGKRHSAGKHPVTGEKLHWEYIDAATR